MKLSRRFTRREKVLMVILTVLLLIAGYFQFIHRPIVDELDSIAQRQEDADLSIMVLETKAALLADMRAELERVHADPNIVEIPSYDNLQKVMIFLNATLASTTDYDLNFRQVLIPEEGNIVRRGIDMSFQCASYSDAKAVISALHASPYRCQLSSLDISPVGGAWDLLARSDTIEAGSVSVSLTLTFFETKQ